MQQNPKIWKLSNLVDWIKGSVWNILKITEQDKRQKLENSQTLWFG